jgi:VanZ family protein
MVLLAGAYGAVARRVITPEEQLHFLQYGLVGVLFVRAVRPSLRNEAAAYGMAFILAFVAGWFDEWLQGHLPNRHYDVHDIALNAVSAFLGLVVYRVIPRKGDPWPKF